MENPSEARKGERLAVVTDGDIWNGGLSGGGKVGVVLKNGE